MPNINDFVYLISAEMHTYFYSQHHQTKQNKENETKLEKRWDEKKIFIAIRRVSHDDDNDWFNTLCSFLSLSRSDLTYIYFFPFWFLLTQRNQMNDIYFIIEKNEKREKSVWLLRYDL